MNHTASTTELTRSSTLASQINKDWWWSTFFLVLFSITFSFLKTETSLQRLDFVFYDYLSSIARESQTNNAQNNQTVLIIIDDYSLEQMGHWPWRRNDYARLLNRLHLAKAVGVDIIFQDFNPMYPTDDAFLSYSIQRHGRVVLANTISSDNTRIHNPIEPLSSAAAALGYINAYPDRDGVLRSSLLFSSLNDELTPHFTLAMFAAAGEKDLLDAIQQDKPKENKLIPFLGPAGSFETYSFFDVLNGSVDPTVFKDRYVIIGAWSSGLGDYYPTPLSSHSQTSMSGVEILANVLENALNNNWIRTPSVLISALLSALPVFFMCYVLRSLPPRRAVLGTLAVLLWIFIASWFLLHVLHIWAPPSAAILGTLLAYPIWYWRSQETVIRYVNKELSVMSKQDPTLNQAIQSSPNTNSLPERLAHLHKAIELLREAQQRREETLRFISHDMRAPQNSILSLIKMQRNNELHLDLDAILDQVENYSKSTLELVNDFMDLARVEAMEVSFESTCLNDVLAEICDEAWIRARAKHINVQFQEPEQTVWASIAPSLFKRTLANLIDNSIKYSLANTTVICKLLLIDNTVTITIQDQGWGIPAKALPTIFQPFKRAHTSRSDDPSGSGLGLAFVHTVITRHFGKITVASTEYIGTTFTIEIPAEAENTNSY